MTRNKRFKRDAWYLDLLANKVKKCALCGREWTLRDIPEIHHVHGTDWKKNCKSHEEIHVDFRGVRVCGPATDGASCHAKLATTYKNQQTKLVRQTLRQLGEDVDQRMEEAGYLG